MKKLQSRQSLRVAKQHNLQIEKCLILLKNNIYFVDINEFCYVKNAVNLSKTYPEYKCLILIKFYSTIIRFILISFSNIK